MIQFGSKQKEEQNENQNEYIEITKYIQKFEEIKQFVTKYSQPIDMNKPDDINYHDENDEFEETELEKIERMYRLFQTKQKTIENILQKETEIQSFFMKCKDNKKVMEKQNNQMIDLMISLKKKRRDENIQKNPIGIVQYKESFEKYKKKWDNKRSETIDEKNRRETEELLIQIREERDEMFDIIKTERNEIAELVEQVVNQLRSEQKNNFQYSNTFNNYHNNNSNEIISNNSDDSNDSTNDDESINENYDFEEGKNEKEIIKELQKEFSQLTNELNALLSQNNQQQINFTNELIDEEDDNEENDDFILTKQETKILQQWTKKKIGKVIFDTDIDEWDEQTSQLNKKLLEKGQLIFLIEDTNQNLFGYYEATDIEMEFLEDKETSEESFLFSLRSNGRSQHPLKFEIIDTDDGYCLYNNSSDHLIDLAGGSLVLYKERLKSSCMYNQFDENFNYHETENIICEDESFTLKHLIVIQMI